VVAFANLGDALTAACDESESLRRLGEKKSILLSELAHGVANNFAAVVAFISLKADSVSDTTARTILDEAIEQVNVMGRVHRQLRAVRASGRDDKGPRHAKSHGRQQHARGRCPRSTQAAEDD
jgi:hypothetical protein